MLLWHIIWLLQLHDYPFYANSINVVLVKHSAGGGGGGGAAKVDSSINSNCMNFFQHCIHLFLSPRMQVVTILLCKHSISHLVVNEQCKLVKNIYHIGTNLTNYNWLAIFYSY